MAKLTQVIVTLAPNADGSQYVTIVQGEDLDIAINEGILIIYDSSSIVFAAAKDGWLSASPQGKPLTPSNS